MRIVKDTSIDFMKYRQFWVSVSIALVLVGIYVVFIGGHLNMGIDFSGGTQITAKFDREPDLVELRQVLERAGIPSPVVQRFGEEGDHEVLIKTPVDPDHEEGRREEIVTALDGWLQQSENGLDLNRQGSDALAAWLAERNPDGIAGTADEIRAHYDTVAQAIGEVRRQQGRLSGVEAIRGLPEVSAETADVIGEQARFGRLAITSAGNVSPQIGSEMRQRGILAVSMALLGMLAYIWWRFEIRFGIGALAALVHDVFVSLAIFTIAGFEFNLTTVAGFLTLVGYSVNDSVVVFDRVRENLRQVRSKPLIDVINMSLNQTLSRTILTSGTTLLAVGSLLFLGGEVLKGFAFILFIGVIAGTYSSIYIASPFTLLWERLFRDKGGAASGRVKTTPA